MHEPPPTPPRRSPVWVLSPVAGAIYLAFFVALFIVEPDLRTIPLLVNLAAGAFVMLDPLEREGETSAQRFAWVGGTLLVGPLVYLPYTLFRTRA